MAENTELLTPSKNTVLAVNGPTCNYLLICHIYIGLIYEKKTYILLRTTNN